MSCERHTRSYTASRSGFSTSRLGDGENHKRIEAWSVARGAAVSISPVVSLHIFLIIFSQFFICFHLSNLDFVSYYSSTHYFFKFSTSFQIESKHLYKLYPRNICIVDCFHYQILFQH